MKWVLAAVALFASLGCSGCWNRQPYYYPPPAYGQATYAAPAYATPTYSAAPICPPGCVPPPQCTCP